MNTFNIICSVRPALRAVVVCGVALCAPAAAIAQNAIDADGWINVSFTQLEAAARAVLTAAQADSFRQNREFCGYIGVDEDGYLRTSKPLRGSRDGCRPDAPESWELVASYHTHAAYDPDAASEWPSSDDVYGDADEGVDGFVATPGGRFWFIDGERLTAHQVCGVGCLPVDPRFVRESDPPKQRYTVRQLEAIE